MKTFSTLLCTLSLLSCLNAGAANKEDDVEPLNYMDDIELILQTHSQDFDGHVNWWVTLPDKTPVEQLSSGEFGDSSFLIPATAIEWAHPASIREPSSVELILHASNPSWYGRTGAAKAMNLGQNHFSFPIVLTFNAYGGSVETIPYSPMLDTLNVAAAPQGGLDQLVLHLRSYEASQFIWSSWLKGKKTEVRSPESSVYEEVDGITGVTSNSGPALTMLLLMFMVTGIPVSGESASPSMVTQYSYSPTASGW